MASKLERNFKSSGSWRTTPGGKLEYRFMYIDEFDRRKQKSVTGETEEECFRRADRFLTKMEGIRAGAIEDPTLVELLERKYRLDYEMHFTGEQGYGRNMDGLKHLRKTRLGQTPVSEIRKEQILGYLRMLPKYSDNTISKFYRQLKTGFRVAQEKGMIEKDPMNDSELRRPRSSKATKEVHALTLKEQRRLVNYLTSKSYRFGSNDYRLQILISLFSGMRMGEVNALHPEDIDFKKGVVHVRHTVSRGFNRIFIKDGTKTPAGMRDIPISNALRPWLEKALDEFQENDLDLLFYNFRQNGIVESHQVNSYFRRVCMRLEIPVYGQHCLRHTFATRCIESGVRPVVLKTWLGHRDIHTTLDTYTDVFDNLHDDSINVFDSYLGTV